MQKLNSRRSLFCSKKICERTWYVSIPASCQTQSPGFRNAVWNHGSLSFARNGALKTRYFAARKLTYRTRSQISSKRQTARSLGKRLQRPFLKSYSHHSVYRPPPPPLRPLSPPIFTEGRGSVHRLHCYCHLIKKYVLSRPIKETRTKTLHYNNLKMYIKKKKDKNYLFEDSFFFSFIGLLGVFFSVLWLLWKRVYSRWCSQISSTSCLFCSVYGYLSFQHHHCPQSVSMPRS